MMTVHEVSRLTGVSIRALQYYDRIGLLSPAARTDAGYRLYDESALEILQQILLFRELEFPLKDIQRILQSPSYDRDKALDQQITLLRLKKERLEQLIELARRTKQNGGRSAMDFSAFDTQKLDEYAAQARASWGATPEYREFEAKTKDRTPAETQELSGRMMQIFAQLGAVRHTDPAGEEAQRLVRTLQAFITEHFYTCSDQVLCGLGQLYAAGGEMTDNIDRAGGEGTALFTSQAIRAYCGRER